MDKSFHIYLRDEVLFKNLNQEEFDLIWDKIYHSYYKEELSYETIYYDNSMAVDASY
tara:strand:+ start:59 stop:229 length:171 start_codon:yes stop_codon:yes gene_type:complete